MDSINRYFESRFGVSLEVAAGNPEVVERLRAVHGCEHPASSMQEEDFGRGHVFLNRAVSVEAADRETMQMFSRWA